MIKLWQKIKNSDFYKTFKEELIVVPLLFIAFYLINIFFTILFPHSAFFDFFSQIETIFSKIVLFFVSLWVAHLSLRIAFPSVYQFLHENIYTKFSDIPQDRKIDYAIKFILTFILASALVFRSGGVENPEVRSKLLIALNSQLNVRETKGENRSPEVDKYNKSVGAPLGSSWCGAFVGYNLTEFNIPNPNSAWSPDYAKPQDIIWTYPRPTTKPLTGDVVTYYFNNLGRVGHTGFYINTDSDGYFITIEGNTGSGTLNREGDGVYKRKRHPCLIHAISRYIK